MTKLTPKKRAPSLTVNLDAALIEQIRDCVVALAGPPHVLTLAKFVQSASARELARLQRSANRGKPFPRRAADVKRGRPIR
jgi:hypothetical protein